VLAAPKSTPVVVVGLGCVVLSRAFTVFRFARAFPGTGNETANPHIASATTTPRRVLRPSRRSFFVRTAHFPVVIRVRLVLLSTRWPSLTDTRAVDIQTP
jgi:hypothetical protein